MRLLLAAWAVLAAAPARASFLSGEALDTAADVMALVVLFIVPVVAIVVFWIVHVLPEKIAHRRHHPQRDAITTLCLLSLVFGGLLWPIAWLWAYSKPVMHKLAYGTDVDESHGHEANPLGVDESNNHDVKPLDETVQLRLRVAELESQLSRKGAV